ncbi:hypothetical protein EYF80_048472 [Liparis tanakae]|uniref:Uncharacterized protein n=1 Tax=Liparis tanakae TaxID=230148 RepID=A0A4Z2FJN0_9TELE|nr:hypothetical protein EYF80_048472 [Liparis tanakae]
MKSPVRGAVPGPQRRSARPSEAQCPALRGAVPGRRSRSRSAASSPGSRRPQSRGVAPRVRQVKKTWFHNRRDDEGKSRRTSDSSSHARSFTRNPARNHGHVDHQQTTSSRDQDLERPLSGDNAFSLLTTRGLLWLYRSLCFMCKSCILFPDHQGTTPLVV